MRVADVSVVLTGPHQGLLACKAEMLSTGGRLGGFPSPTSLVAQTEKICSAGDLGLIPEWGRFSGEENGNALQYSCLENFMDRGPRQAI